MNDKEYFRQSYGDWLISQCDLSELNDIWNYKYTLEDLIKYTRPGNYFPSYYYIAKEGLSKKEFIDILEYVYPDIDFDSYEDDILKSSEANLLWCSYIVPRYRKNIVCSVPEELDFSKSILEPFREWISKYIVVFQRTYSKYKTLLDYYTSAEKDLMSSISSSTRFNDTPQDSQISNNFGTDEYTTTITTSLTDGNTKIGRLAEIRNKWDNIYRDWSDEFVGIFVSS